MTYVGLTAKLVRNAVAKKVDRLTDRPPSRIDLVFVADDSGGDGLDVFKDEVIVLGFLS